VQCATDAQCTASPSRAFCVANTCTGCNTTGATGCSTRSDGKTICATATSTSAGQCVECNVDSDCTGASTGFCVANVCVGCNAPGATGCAARTAGKTVCSTAGATAGECVECTADSQCTQNPAAAFCVANTCTGCNTAGATGCSGRTDGKTVCASTGTLAGQCVACVTSTDCTIATLPICTANVCGACTADSQCAAKLGSTGNPGVCLDNIDGHCASDAETVYVQNSTDCSNTAAGGTAAAPFCAAQAGIGAAKSSGKPLVVITGTLAALSTTLSLTAPLTIVGKSSATLTPTTGGDGIDITSGTVYLRNLTVQGAASDGIGINATPGVTLHMTGCAVTDNPGGGILLNGAAFDIANTTVTGNGPGNFGGLTTWGGILVNAPPSAGPATLDLVTIQDNNAAGVSCSGAITGSGVLATGNLSTQVTPSCSFTACTSASTTCGAQ
jgi:hypothetical protein